MVDHQEGQALGEGTAALADGGVRGGERAGQDRERELLPQRRRQADADPQGPAAAGPAVFSAQGAVRGTSGGGCSRAMNTTMSDPDRAAVPGAVAPSHLVMLSAMALADAIRARQVSCVEVISAYLDHIERINPLVNAIVALRDRDDLLAEAKEKDVARGEATGPLHGLPFAVKDLFPVKGMRTTSGSL